MVVHLHLVHDPGVFVVREVLWIVGAVRGEDARLADKSSSQVVVSSSLPYLLPWLDVTTRK
jgi:hypothetical protein